MKVSELIILSFFCFFFSSVLFASDLNLVVNVSDAKTKEGLPFATVYLKNNGIGTTTNFEGLAQMKSLKVEYEKDTLICSYIGYQQKEIPVNLKTANKLEIELEAMSIMLSEVVVTSRKPLSANQILKNVKKKIAQNYSTEPANLKGFYRETIKENDRYIQLNEAAVKFYYTAYPQKFDRKIWQDWYYDDRYAFEYQGSLFSETVHHFNTKKDQVKIVGGRKSENQSKYNYETSILGGPLSLSALDLVKYQCDFLNPKLFKKYNYLKKDNEIINTHNCYVLQFYPKPSGKKMVFDMGKKLKRSIYVGKLYIDMESFAVVKMEYQIAKDIDFQFFQSRMPLDYQVSVAYQKNAEKWFLQKVNLRQVRITKKEVNDYYKLQQPLTLEASQQLEITEIEKDKAIPLKEEDTYKHTRFSALRYHELPAYNANFWEQYEKGTFSVLAEQIKNDLEKEKPLEVQFQSKLSPKQDLEFPTPSKKSFSFDYPFETLQDDYQWMANTTYKEEYTDYLKAEKAYTKNYFLEHKEVQRNLFNDLNYFYLRDTNSVDQTKVKGDLVIGINADDETVLYEYSDSTSRTGVFNISRFKAEYRNSFMTTSFVEHHNYVSFTCTDDGGLNNYLLVFEKGNQRLVDSISEVYSYEWFDENNILYCNLNKRKRSDQLFYHNINTKRDTSFLFEKDLTFDIALEESVNYIFCIIQSKEENEIYLIKKGELQPNLQLLKKRRTGISYSIKEFNNELFLLTNENAINNKICSLSSSLDWDSSKEIVAHNKEELIDDFILTPNYIILKTYKNSFPIIKYRHRKSSTWETLSFNQKIYDSHLKNLEGDKIEIYYSNPSTLPIRYEFDLQTGKLNEQKRRKSREEKHLPYFETKRLWAKSKDGTMVPMTFIQNKTPIRKHKGLILKAYGAYGAITGGYFSAQDAILLKDGFTIVYAHVRGEQILGNEWYEDGKQMNKENSFDDYIACAEYLIKKKYTDSKHLVGYGNSAGGLIMGVAINRRPELFNTVILDHPYLDVLTTMMDETLPLTTDEYKEWGNPKEKNVYKYIKGYSPYQNIKKQAYPNLLFIASTNDYQTPAWQIAKYVAKLREFNTGSTKVLFDVDFGSGHIGNTTGKEWIKKYAMLYAFVYGNLFE